MALIKHARGNRSKFQGKTYDSDTIYFIEDEKKIQLGEDDYTGIKDADDIKNALGCVNDSTASGRFLQKDGTWQKATDTRIQVNNGAWQEGEVSLTIPTQASDISAATANHSHGNITNSGDITATAPTIANGDQLVINDNSASKITNGPTFDGTTTSKALTPKGTWETFLQSGDISGMATQTWVNDKINDLVGIDAQGISEIAAIIADEDTTTGILTQIAGKVNKSTVTAPSSVPTASFGNTVTVGSVDGKDFKFTMPSNPNTNTVTLFADTTNKKIHFTESGDADIYFIGGDMKVTVKDGHSVQFDANITPGKAVVSTTANQGLSSDQKSAARANIGAGTSSFSGSYNDLTNKPTIPTVNDATFSIKTKVGTASAVTAADFTANQSSADDITIIQGSNVTLTTDATNRTVTIAATDTTYSAVTSSANGLMTPAMLNALTWG